jgi:mRNA interferase YafQ
MKRDAKRMAARGKDMTKLTETLNLLASETRMPAIYKDHPLKGEMRGYRECHIEPDWLLVYQIVKNKMTLYASGTGTHSDVFDA